jgi:hypothetical protein
MYCVVRVDVDAMYHDSTIAGFFMGDELVSNMMYQCVKDTALSGSNSSIAGHIHIDVLDLERAQHDQHAFRLKLLTLKVSRRHHLVQ